MLCRLLFSTSSISTAVPVMRRTRYRRLMMSPSLAMNTSPSCERKILFGSPGLLANPKNLSVIGGGWGGGGARVDDRFLVRGAVALRTRNRLCSRGEDVSPRTAVLGFFTVFQQIKPKRWISDGAAAVRGAFPPAVRRTGGRELVGTTGAAWKRNRQPAQIRCHEPHEQQQRHHSKHCGEYHLGRFSVPSFTYDADLEYVSSLISSFTFWPCSDPSVTLLTMKNMRSR